MDGFTHDELAMEAPSVTNRLGTSWAWLYALSTDVLEFRPIRAVPISWIANPGSAPSWSPPVYASYVRTFLHPAASSISAADAAMSLRIASSLSPQVQWIFSNGMPNSSVWSESVT